MSPILLRAQITPLVGGGATGVGDPTQLENPFQEPMWLDEIRFRLPDVGTWSQFLVELRLGQLPITKGFVPVGLLGKVLNESGVIGESDPAVFTWKLPRPLYIPPREFLRPTIYFEPLRAHPSTGSAAVTGVVTIVYVCRSIPEGTPPPQTAQIPWVSHFRPPVVTVDVTGGSDRTDQSTPSDLYNPWDQELHVQRFVGRASFLDTTGAAAENNTFMSLASANVNRATGKVTSGTLISAQDSFNNILIRDRAPFAHVFDAIDRAWTVNCVLPPKGYYLFTIDRLWAAYLADVRMVGTVGISMVGWREVQVYGAARPPRKPLR